MIYTFDYDESYLPSIPAVEIAIRYSKNVPSTSLRAIVDSGADATIIPLHYLQAVQTRKGKVAWLRGTTQHRIQVERYWIWIQIGNLRPFYIQAISDDRGEEAVLGRDVLNQLIVTLNGLASVVEISD